MSLGRERIDRALAGLGDPHAQLAAVHVAGTNGKGSVCALVEAAARAVGLKTGLYTSPHLCRVAERIQIDGRAIDDDLLADGLARVLGAEPHDLTFFETLTAVAFDVFAREGVDLAIVEVGLGGRHDATNVLARPIACGITTVELDHENLLGTTRAEIAREKSGILKPGVPAVIGVLGAEAASVVGEEASRVGAAPLWWLREAGGAPAHEHEVVCRASADGVALVEVPGGAPQKLPRTLDGAHQVENLAVAWGLLQHVAPLAPGWDPERAAGALGAVRWPGRLERIDGTDLARPRPGVSVLLDCAHNPAGAAALARTLAEGDPARRVLVYGALADKAWRRCLEHVAPLAETRLYTCPKGRPPAPPEELAAFAPGLVEPDPARAIERALDLAPRGATVLVTGSIYLVGEIRAALLGLAADPVIAL